MDFKAMLNQLSQLSEATKETPTGKVHKADPGGYGRKDDEDDKKKEKAAEPAVKRGRGRPKKGADSETGEVAKYTNAPALQSFMVGNLPKGKLPGKTTKKHTLKDWMEIVEDNMLAENEVKEALAPGQKPIPVVDKAGDTQQTGAGFLNIDDTSPAGQAMTKALGDLVSQKKAQIVMPTQAQTSTAKPAQAGATGQAQPGQQGMEEGFNYKQVHSSWAVLPSNKKEFSTPYKLDQEKEARAHAERIGGKLVKIDQRGHTIRAGSKADKSVSEGFNYKQVHSSWAVLPKNKKEFSTPYKLNQEKEARAHAERIGGKLVKIDQRGHTIKAGSKADKSVTEGKLDYSAKKARAGQDIGKPGKQFAKIAKDAAERYGSEEKGKKVAGAVLKKLRNSQKESIDEAIFPDSPIGDKLRQLKRGLASNKPVAAAGAIAAPAVGALGATVAGSSDTALPYVAGNLGAGAAGSVWLPIAGAAALGALATVAGGYLSYKALNWLARKVFGTTEEAIEFAQSHIAAAKAKQPSFMFQGKKYPVKISSPEQAGQLEYKIAQLKSDLESRDMKEADIPSDQMDMGAGLGAGRSTTTLEGKRAKPDFLDLDKDGNKKESMKKAAHDKKKKKVTESSHRHSAAKLLGKSHALAKEGYNCRFEDMDEARLYHEGYKEGLDECYGQGVYEMAPPATVPGMASAAMSMPSMEEDMFDEAMFDEGNAFTGALANTPKGGKFSLGGKSFTDTSDLEEMSLAFESLDKQLKSLLESEEVTEGMTVSISKGQQGMPDSVTVSAQDSEADQLLGLIKQAGLGLFGDNQSSGYGAPQDSQDTKMHGDISVVGDHDGMMGLMKKFAGIEGGQSQDYEDEEGHDEHDYHDHGEEVCETCHQSQCQCEESEQVQEVESEDQMEFEVAEDQSDAEEKETTADEDAEAQEDKALAIADANLEEEQVDESLANGADDTFEADIHFMTKAISGGLNKQKATGQTTIPVIAGQTDRMGYNTNESVQDWKKLAGIK